MNNSEKLKLFISYSHKDESHINQFKQIVKNDIDDKITVWYDREIEGGEDWKSKIDNNLEDADIVCLFISKNFLKSNACLNEKVVSFELKKTKNIRVIPIILEECNWKDDKKLSSTQALPTDGQPITKFSDQKAFWDDVSTGLKRIVQTEHIIKNISISEEHNTFLEDAELLSNAHPDKTPILISDIFVYPDLQKIDHKNGSDKFISSEKIINEILTNPRILIAGENQSGKTTLCKQLFTSLRNMNLLPIIISDDNGFRGETSKLIERKFNEQYVDVVFSEIDKERIVLILDDFHKAKNKDRFVKNISEYKYQILITDDIYSLDLKDEFESDVYALYKMQEFNATLRNELIEKWIYLSDTAETFQGNGFYESLDQKTEQINTTLGKIFGKGIMSAYPFNILSILNNFETATTPVSSQITSQGYCYEALIIFFLKKNGVKNDEFNYYINFLQEFAYYLFSNKKRNVTDTEFESFIISYGSKFNILKDQVRFLKTLEKTNLIQKDGLKNYSFYNEYIYYFFVAKHLADQIDDNNEEIKKSVIVEIVNNLHKTENAYISIFIAHHTKNNFLFTQLINSASGLFSESSSASLTKDELKFLDEKEDMIIKATLPNGSTNPKKERAKILSAEDEIEKKENDEEEVQDHQEFRKSIKTVEVIGSIIKNRAGSIEKNQLKKLFIDAMSVHLRILTHFIEFIKEDKNQEDVISLISEQVNRYIEIKNEKVSIEEIEKVSRHIFWNLNFFMVYGILEKIILSLGSNKLEEILVLINNEINTPAVDLINIGIHLRYMHKVNTPEISKKLKSKEYSKTAKQIINYEVVRFSLLNNLKYAERQQIESLLDIPKSKLSYMGGKK
ncbi:MAG: TIR domain-containing protein [bacterium]